MGSDGGWEGEGEVTDSDCLLDVGEVDHLVVDVTAVGFGGAVGELTINPCIDGGQDRRNE